MFRYISWTLAVALIAVGLMSASARADVIVIKPVTATASTFYSTSFYYPADLIQLVQTSSNVVKFIQPNMAIPTGPSGWYVSDNSGEGWESTSGVIADQWVLLDLGSPKNLGFIDLWNQYQGNNDETKKRSTKDLTVWASDASHNDNTLLATIVGLAQGYPAPLYGEKFALTGATNVQYVKLKIGSSYSGLATGTVGLGWVSFEGVVPEPGTLALLAAGLAGLLCYAWRNRR